MADGGGEEVLIVEPGAFRANPAGAVMWHGPIPPIHADVVGGTRDIARGMDGTQAGDPMNAAAATEQDLGADMPPLRLGLGHDATAG
jgi:hypothetical protein